MSLFDMETEDTNDIRRAIDQFLKPPKTRRESTVKHYRKKYYAENAVRLKEARSK